uniref:Uncharacterized protein n=1 Tax=Octopus bimaculoides TaxID=37653 RepID=A0A0L8IHM1_OCTBM
MVKVVCVIYVVLLAGLLESCFARSAIFNGDTEGADNAFSLEKRREILYEDYLSANGRAGGAGDDLSPEKRSVSRRCRCSPERAGQRPISGPPIQCTCIRVISRLGT